MRQFHHPLFSFLLGLSVVAWVGCDNADKSTTTTTTTETDSHGHDEGEHEHEEGDDHDHDGDGKPDHDADDHDGHDHDGAEHKHESFPEAIAELVSLRDEIAKGIADGDPESIDSQVHHVGELLEDIGGLNFNSKLPQDQKDKNIRHVDTLFDAFDAVDAKIHGREGKDFDDVKDKIEEAIKALQDSIKGLDSTESKE